MNDDEHPNVIEDYALGTAQQLFDATSDPDMVAAFDRVRAVLGSDPSAAFAWTRCIEESGDNMPIGPSPEADLDAFLDHFAPLVQRVAQRALGEAVTAARSVEGRVALSMALEYLKLNPDAMKRSLRAAWEARKQALRNPAIVMVSTGTAGAAPPHGWSPPPEGEA